MVGQSRRETGTPAGRIKLGRQQLNKINLANEVLELKVRTPMRDLPGKIFLREKMSTRGLSGRVSIDVSPVAANSEMSFRPRG